MPLAAASRFVGARPDRRRLVVYDAGHELTEVLDELWAETSRFVDEVSAGR